MSPFYENVMYVAMNWKRDPLVGFSVQAVLGEKVWIIIFWKTCGKFEDSFFESKNFTVSKPNVKSSVQFRDLLILETNLYVWSVAESVPKFLFHFQFFVGGMKILPKGIGFYIGQKSRKVGEDAVAVVEQRIRFS